MFIRLRSHTLGVTRSVYVTPPQPPCHTCLMPTIRERNGVFQAIVRIKQYGALVHTEAKSFSTRALAQSWGERLEARIKKEGVQARQSSRHTFSDLIGKYRKTRAEVKPMGRAMSGDLDMLESHLGTRGLEELTSQVWSTFARKRRDSGAGPATVMHNLSIARIVLNSAKPLFGIATDASELTQAVKALANTGHVGKSQERDRRPTAAELLALDQDFRRLAFHPATQIRMPDVLAIAVALPRRLGELCRMEWVDYKGGILTLRDTKHPKKPRTETVPVPPAARAVIDTLPRFDARMLPYNSESVSASFERACKRLGIEDLRFHDLRHEGICRLFESGLQIQEVAMVSGHLSWTTLKRYTHLRPQDVLEKMNARP